MNTTPEAEGADARMNAEQRQRAGQAVAARIEQLRTTVPALAKTARVHPSTVRALIRGERWPTQATRDRLNKALGWPEGEIARRAVDDTPGVLDQCTTLELLAEVHSRVLAAGI